MTTEDSVLLRESAVHTHTLPAKCKLTFGHYTEIKRCGYVGEVTQNCRRSETYADK